MSDFRLPAEWEEHEATWLAWPHNLDTWVKEDLSEAQKEYAAFIYEISKGEKINLLIPGNEQKEYAVFLLEKLKTDLSKINFIEYATNDAWIRDYGPDFLISGDEYKVLNWTYNSWGGKYLPFDSDNAFTIWLEEKEKWNVESIDFVLEGGSIEINGAGDLITTESCLLNKNRNPNYSKREIEGILKARFNVKNIIWLKGGLEGDDTDGHIDDLTRFVNKNTVVTVSVTDKEHFDYGVIQENTKRLKEAYLISGEKINIVELPQAPFMKYEDQVLPTSYANFYICNSAVIVPQFGVENDLIALSILSNFFNDRKVIGLPSKSIILGQGNFHCLSKQQAALSVDK